MTEHQVFISYSSKDAEIAAEVCSALESAGVRCWIAPRDILPGPEWAGQIMGALSTSRVMVVVFSASSNESKQVLREVERAVKRGVTILPFRIEAVEPSDSMEYFLGVPHWLDALTRPLEPHLGQLVRSVQTLLGMTRVATPAAEVATVPSGLRSPRGASRFAQRRVMTAAAAVAAVVAAAVGGGLWWRQQAAAADQGVVAVLPFRVSAPDTLKYLRRGVVDLLTEKFKVVTGPGVAHVETVLSAWDRACGSDCTELPREKNLRLAESIGAAQFVVGALVGTGRDVNMTAELVDVRSGQTRVTATARGDDWRALVDTVAATLLSHQAHEEQRLYAFKRVPIPALKAYLTAQESYRRGRYDEAVKYYAGALDSLALDTDSTRAFTALAGLGLVAASNYARIENMEGERGLRAAWPARDWLNARDRAYLIALAAPDYPAISTMREQLKAWERAVDSLPRRPETHFELGERLFMYGRYIGVEDRLDRARRSFDRALKIDTTFAPALQRLAELSLLAGDTAGARRFAERLLRTDSAADRAGFVQWRIALSRGDRRELANLRRRFATLSDASLRQIWMAAQLEGVALEDASSALDLLLDAGAKYDAAGGRYVLAMNRGRVGEALQQLDRSVRPDRSYLLPLIQAQTVRDALFDSGDTTAASRAVAELEKTIADIETTKRELGDLSRRDTTSDAILYIALCAVEQWRLAHGRAERAQAVVKRMRDLAPRVQAIRLGGGTTPILGADPTCPAVLEAWSSVVLSPRNARAAVDRLDSLMARGPMDADASIGNLAVARWREAQGDVRGALRALRRRPYAIIGLFYLATSLHEEGRLAALLAERGEPAEREAAVRAYRHFLALRSDPDPALRDQVAKARAKLHELERVETIAAHH